MVKARGAWYQRQKDEAKRKRAEAAALRPPKPPGINRDPERKRAYNREWMRAHYHHRPRETRKEVIKVIKEPLPETCIGHPLFDEARAHLRRWELSDFDRDMDSGARDLIGEYVLAKLEGRDPVEAMNRWRTRHNRDRKALVYGLSITDGLER